MRKTAGEWKIYRTRFLIKAKQLIEPLVFVDKLGREHRGQAGDYLVESSDGNCRIAPKEIFEDIYVAMGLAEGNWSASAWSEMPISTLKRRVSPRPGFLEGT